MNKLDLDLLNWHKVNNLMPVIVQDNNTQQVLMLGYMDKAALTQTIKTQTLVFFSRSKNRLWMKGETSGNTLTCIEIVPDCDNDTLLIWAIPNGPTCHLNQASCFSQSIPNFNILNTLENVIAARAKQPKTNSYTTSLFKAGTARIAQKVGEEGVELALAAMQDNKENIVNEAADLLFHTLVLLRQNQIDLSTVYRVLEHRSKNEQ